LTNRKEDEIIEKIMEKNSRIGEIKASRKLHVRKRSAIERGNRRNHVERANKAEQY